MIDACKTYNLTFHVLVTMNVGTGPSYTDDSEATYPYGFTGYRSSWLTKLDDGSTSNTMSFSSNATRERVKQVIQTMLINFPYITDINLDYIRYVDNNYRVPYDDASKAVFQTWLTANGKTFTGNWADYYYGGSHWRDFAQWRCIPINDVVRDVRTWAQAIKPTIMITADVLTPWSVPGWTPDTIPEACGQDVAYWISQGYLEAVNPMNYVPTLADLQYRTDNETTYWLGQSPKGAIPLIPFVTQGGQDADVNYPLDNATWLSQIDYIRTKCNGFIIWKYEGPGFVTGDFTPLIDYLELINKSSTKGMFTTFDQYRPSVSGSVIAWTTTVSTTGSVEYSTLPIFPGVPYSGTKLYYMDIDYSPGTVITNSTASTQHVFTVPIPPPFYYRVIDNDGNIELASHVYLVTG
jgi:hypothetical protein